LTNLIDPDFRVSIELSPTLAVHHIAAYIMAAMSTEPRASLHTIGCRLNHAESALLADSLKQRGYRLVPFGQPTDLLVLNSCSVTDRAESDCRYVIRHALRRSPQAFVAVTGCYAQTGAEALRRMPGVDLIVGTQYKMQLPDWLPQPSELCKQAPPHLLHTRTVDRDDFVLSGVGQYDTQRANLKIQDGCNFMCSFCIIPFARGHERSRELADTVREAEALVAQGHRELVLTGVNIGRYQPRDLESRASLLALIKRLEEIDGLARIRISSIEPTTIPDDLLEHMAQSSKLCHYLHVPLQSGDDTVLRRMNRRHSVREYRAFIEQALAIVPDLGLGTDVMVGFPGEGEREFSNTVAVVSDLPFMYLHVFSFSPRPGTAAARMQDGISAGTIKKRSKLLAELSRAKRLARYKREIGRTVRVLFEHEQRGIWSGFTENFMRVGVRSPVGLTNELHDVVITAATDGQAFGALTIESNKN
jgi:threonylcarbamoyladenosine tRNA methylthiotransferase MtaB